MENQEKAPNFFLSGLCLLLIFLCLFLVRFLPRHGKCFNFKSKNLLLRFRNMILLICSDMKIPIIHMTDEILLMINENYLG